MGFVPVNKWYTDRQEKKQSNIEKGSEDATLTRQGPGKTESVEDSRNCEFHDGKGWQTEGNDIDWKLHWGRVGYLWFLVTLIESCEECRPVNVLSIDLVGSVFVLHIGGVLPTRIHWRNLMLKAPLAYYRYIVGIIDPLVLRFDT